MTLFYFDAISKYFSQLLRSLGVLHGVFFCIFVIVFSKSVVANISFIWWKILSYIIFQAHDELDMMNVVHTCRRMLVDPREVKNVETLLLLSEALLKRLTYTNVDDGIRSSRILKTRMPTTWEKKMKLKKTH